MTLAHRTLLVLALLATGGVARAQCPPPNPTPPKIVEDDPAHGPVPKPTGKKYYMPDTFTMFEKASWLFMFYNGAYRTSPSGTDSVIYHKTYIDEVRQQEEVRLFHDEGMLVAQSAATAMAKKLACGQSGTVIRRDGKVVMGDSMSYSIHLAAGSFSVYYEATCEVGPRQCCVADSSCDSGYGNTSPWSCEVKWTVYDTYNFSSATGTGGTGWLKRANFLGWAGTAFSSYGFWTEHIYGKTHECIAAEDVPTACCQPKPAQPTRPLPGPTPGPGPNDGPNGPKPGPEPPKETKSPCPECDPIARDIDLTKKGIAAVDARIKKIEADLAANRAGQKDLDDQIKAAEKELNAGGWTASGSDPDTGITKDYDATKGDGQVHVTVRDGTGKVVKEYSYPRSKSKTDVLKKIEGLKKLKQALIDDVAYLDKLMATAQKQREVLVGNLALLEKQLADCLERCHHRTAYNPTPYKWRLHALVGGDLELYNEPHQFLAAVELGYRVLPRGGDVVFVPEVKTNGNLTTVSIPVGFQYDFALPVKGLYIYPRATIGYAVSVFTTTVPGGTVRTVAHLGVASALAGLKYVFKKRWDVVVEPVGLTTFFSKNGASLSWRIAAGAGVAF